MSPVFHLQPPMDSPEQPASYQGLRLIPVGQAILFQGEEQGTEQLGVRSACDTGRQIKVTDETSRSIRTRIPSGANAYLPSSAA
jgi:hypothetical protein